MNKMQFNLNGAQLTPTLELLAPLKPSSLDLESAASQQREQGEEVRVHPAFWAKLTPIHTHYIMCVTLPMRELESDSSAGKQHCWSCVGRSPQNFC